MQVYKNFNFKPPANKKIFLSLGIFDGVHLGHQKIIKTLKKKALKENALSVVLTFDPHPANILSPDKVPYQIISLKEKKEIFRNLGIDILLLINFNKKIVNMEAKQFIEEYLVSRLKAKEIFIGFNYCFGKNQKGNYNFLRRYGKKYGFKVHQTKPVCYKNKPISSTRIREEIKKGNIKNVEAMLGREYKK